MTLQMLFGVPGRATAAAAEDPAQVHAAAARGTATPPTTLPFADRIQRAFGRHDISGIQAHVGGQAAASARDMGARAYATGDHVVLTDGADMHTVAHEAAHVVQQRGGVQLKRGVGEPGDAYERHADEVADRVVRGDSAEPLLDRFAGASSRHGPATPASVQKEGEKGGEKEGEKGGEKEGEKGGENGGEHDDEQDGDAAISQHAQVHHVAPQMPLPPLPQQAPSQAPARVHHVAPPRPLPALPQQAPPQAPARAHHAAPQVPLPPLPQQALPQAPARVHHVPPPRPVPAAPVLNDPHGIVGWPVPPHHTAPHTADRDESELELANTVQEGSEQVGGVGEALDQTGLYILHEAKKSEEPDEHQIHTAHSVEAAGSGVGAVTSAVGGVAGLVGFVSKVREFHRLRKHGKLTWLEGLELSADGASDAVNAGAGLGNTLNNAGKMGAGIGSVTTSSSAAVDAVHAFDGIGGGIGVVSNSAQALLSGSDVVLGVIRNIRHHSAHKETDWASVGVEAIATLEHFLGTARSAIGSVNGFLKVAGHAGDLANAMPIVGAVANCALEMLQIAGQVMKFVKRLRKLIRAAVTARDMKQESEDAKVFHEAQLFKHLAAVNTKRWKRQIVPLSQSVVETVAALVSICGSVMNICGTVTAPAYGAGLGVMAAGYGLSATSGMAKLGASLAQPVAKLHRRQKQYARDVKAYDERSKLATAYRNLHLTAPYNAGKSSARKDQACLVDIERLFDMMRALPPYIPIKQDIVDRYKRVHRFVRATGVNTRALYAEQNQTKAVRMLLDALKKRD